MALTLDKLVAAYVDRWNRLDEMDARHKREKKVLAEQMQTLSAGMQAIMIRDNIKNQATDHGTVYKAPWTSVKVIDWEATLDWIKDNERWDLLTHAVSKTEVLNSIKVVDEETGEESEDPDYLPPGLKLEKGWKPNVRRT